MQHKNDRYELWQHLLNEHGIIATESQIDEIINLAIKAADKVDFEIAEN